MTNALDGNLVNHTDDVVTANKSEKRKRPPALKAMIVLCFLLILVLLTMALLTSMDEVTNVFDAGKVDIILKEPDWNPPDAQHVVPEQEIFKNPYIYNNENTDVSVFLKVTVPCVQTEIEKNKVDNDKGKVLLNETDSSNGNKVTVPMYKFMIMTEGRNTPNDKTDDTYEYDQSIENAPAANENDYFKQKINGGWTLMNNMSGMSGVGLSTDGKTYTYIYAHTGNDEKLLPLKPDTQTEYPLFDKIKIVNFDENYDPNRNYSILVEAYGIQSYFLRENNGTTYEPVEVWNMINQ